MAFLDVWVEPFNHCMFMLVTQFLRLVTMFGVGTIALNWDWRKTFSICTVLMALQDFMVNFVATWGYMRWQNAYLGLSSLSAIPQTIIFLFNSYIIVEVADVGNESMVFALMSSFSNLGWPLGTVLAKTFDSFLDANLDSIEDDSTKTRWQITYSLLASSAMKLATLALLAMLPRQKSFVHSLKRMGNSSQSVPVILVCCFALGYVVSFVSNVLSILSGTQCLVLAGGRGC
ncbi:unnamed protein product [Aphanomyces euteiches]